MNAEQTDKNSFSAIIAKRMIVVHVIARCIPLAMLVIRRVLNGTHLEETH